MTWAMTYAPVLHRLCHSPSPLTSSATRRTSLTLTTTTVRCSCSTSKAKGEEMAVVKAIRVHELGGPEVMRWEQVEVGEPKDGEIRIKNTAIGVNFIDVYYRQGVYSAPLPFVPGMEAVGVVTAVGPGLTGRKVGDVVAYAGNPMGSYAQEQIIPASVAVPLPPSIDHNTAAAIMLKGMTAHVLLRRVFKASVECLAGRGMLVSFGQSSGRPDPIPLSDLATKSLFVTRPSLMHYTGSRDELLESAGEVFANVGSGVLRIRVNHTYPLSQAASAHADLQARKTSGSILLIPDDA